ncbi:hypothetical protein Glove_168g254 [Diversispora epigaea]|uniref:Uncharacterized protein n=1 Tax=Diversispora epigaea TaxID=1348612 RepID=A0A397IWD5_9GLOM|nr:hypothetical protein Glove_168g254 [Diversispora epigaea]
MTYSDMAIEKARVTAREYVNSVRSSYRLSFSETSLLPYLSRTSLLIQLAFQVNQDNVREILLVPTIHTTNRALVVIINYINFGKWKSETAKDKKAIEFHGHFHLHLNKNVVYAMEKKKKNEYLYEYMYGKVNDPVQHGLKNYKKLETLRLFNLEMVYINQGFVDLNKKLDGMDKKMSTFMELIMQSFPNSENNKSFRATHEWLYRRYGVRNIYNALFLRVFLPSSSKGDADAEVFHFP